MKVIHIQGKVDKKYVLVNPQIVQNKKGGKIKKVIKITVALYILWVIFDFAATVSAVTEETKTEVVDSYTELKTIGDLKVTTIHHQPQWHFTGYSWKRIQESYSVNGSWIVLTDIDKDTYLWVEYINNRDQAYICRNVSLEGSKYNIPFRIDGNEISNIKYQPNIRHCNLYDLKTYETFKFGLNSTELTIYTDDNNRDGYIAYIDDGTPSYGVYPSSSTNFVGRWLRNVSGNWWNYTYRSYYAFNTSSIPDSDTVLNATIYIKEFSDDADLGEVRVYSVDLGATLDNTDWDAHLTGYWENAGIGQTTNGATNISNNNGYFLNRSFYDPAQATYYRYIYINTSSVNKTGYTDFELKVNVETELAGNPDNTAYWRIYETSASGNTSDPYIVIYHESAAADTTPPDLTFDKPSANNTYTLNVSQIIVNISSNEALDGCNISLWNNDTNYTGENSGDNLANNYTFTGLVNNTEYCFTGFCWDLSSNMNNSEMRCATVNLSDGGCTANITNTSTTDLGNVSLSSSNGTCNSSSLLDYQVWNWTWSRFNITWDQNNCGSANVTNWLNVSYGNYTYNVNCSYVTPVATTWCSPTLISFVDEEGTLRMGVDWSC